MPKRGLRLGVDDYNDIVRHRCLARKRKDFQARVRLRAILLVHDGKTLEQVGQILEVARNTGVWTAPIIADLVNRRFNITYSPSQIRRLLHELGFSLQYPRQEPSEADKKRQATWLEEELPEIKKESKKTKTF